MFGRKKNPILGREYIPQDEESATREIVELSLAAMDIGRRPVLRGQHPKSHGCIRARFEVCADIRDEFRHGLFKTVGTYEALLRFSNFSRADDSQPDARGMAVKLFHNGDAIQDFVMIDHPVFFIRNAADYVVFIRAFVRSRRSKIARRLRFFPEWVKNLIRGLILFFRFYWRRWRELWIS
jgi:catalase